MKVLYVFGLQPKIRSDIADWSPEPHKTSDYFLNKKNEQHKADAKRVLDILFDETDQNSYFGKIILFGSKRKIMHLNNTTLYLVLLMWLRQLQQCFLEKTEYKPARDWNKYGQHCGTPSKVVEDTQRYQTLTCLH